MPFIRICTISVDQVAPFISDKSTSSIKIGERVVFLSNTRYQTFAKDNFVCVSCKLQASYFALEKQTSSKSERYHLNLYGIVDGKEILFTKDHIFPKSRGGTTCLANLQTMCSPCNFAKGDCPGHIWNGRAWDRNIRKRNYRDKLRRVRWKINQKLIWIKMQLRMDKDNDKYVTQLKSKRKMLISRLAKLGGATCRK